MKGLLRNYMIAVASLWATDAILPGFHCNNPLNTYFVGGLILYLLYLFAKPLLQILFLPLSFITLGLSNIVIGLLIFSVFAYYFAPIDISAWIFDGISISSYTIPKIAFGIIPTYIVSAVVYNTISSLLKWLS